jgi:hypothetical protein
MLVSLVALSAPSFAQTFLDPLTMPMGPSATAILADGSTIQGEPKIKAKGIGNIKKVKMKLADGSKRKLGAADIQEFRLVPGGLAKALGAMNTMSSINEMSKTDAGEVMKRDEAVFTSGLLPNGKPALMQLLNPGFEATMQVFPDPAGRETSGVGIGGVSITGGLAKSYLVLKEGQDKAVLVKKQQYDELWDSLYSDCPAMTRPAKPEFETMPADVATHAKSCGPNATKPASTEPVATGPAPEGSPVVVEGATETP